MSPVVSKGPISSTMKISFAQLPALEYGLGFMSLFPFNVESGSKG